VDRDNFEYDVAFSFLDADKAVAIELNEFLSPRLRTFIYVDRQLELAGTDGESTFARVFGQQARAVAVLYREGWGRSKWTRIEQTAIQNRAMQEGYDFALFIPLDVPETKPIWLPDNRLWIGYNAWGARAAAAVIERRASELGSVVRQETLVGREKRVRFSLEQQRLRDAFGSSDVGVTELRKNAEAIQQKVQGLIADLIAGGCPISFTPKRDRSALLVTGAIAGLRVNYEGRFSNVLDSWRLTVDVTRGHPWISTAMYFEDPPPPLLTIKYSAIGGDNLGFRWIEDGAKDGDRDYCSNDQVADRAVRLLLDYIEKLGHEKRC